jgi:hypothetical protein
MENLEIYVINTIKGKIGGIFYERMMVVGEQRGWES